MLIAGISVVLRTEVLYDLSPMQIPAVWTKSFSEENWNILEIYTNLV